jgi:hypothetical protein
MKLGEMLVRDGRLDEAQLEQGLARQAKVGGRLGTVLVEMGLIDADVLTVYLGLELGIPIATGATLNRAKRAAVRLLTPEQAARYRCIPILVQDRQLIAAIDDPLDWQTLDELSRSTGQRVVPRVAPEIRIYYYLELLYGVPRPPRFQNLGQPERAATGRQDLPAPPLPGLPPRTRAPVAAPTPPQPLRAVRATAKPHPPPPPAAAVKEALELDAADLVEELDSSEGAVAPSAPAAEPPPAPSARAVEPEPSHARKHVHEPLTREAALEAIGAAEEREDVANALLGYAIGRFEAALLFMVRDNLAFGWKAASAGAGHQLDLERIDAMLIPLESPSMFQVAIYNQGLFRGRPFPATLHNYLYKVLRISPPPYAAVAVSSIGNRAVNLLYGHIDSGEPLTDDALEELTEITSAASDAYVRLIAASKRRA